MAPNILIIKAHTVMCWWLYVIKTTVSHSLILVIMGDSDGSVLSNSIFGRAMENESLSLPAPDNTCIADQTSPTPLLLFWWHCISTKDIHVKVISWQIFTRLQKKLQFLPFMGKESYRKCLRSIGHKNHTSSMQLLKNLISTLFTC